MYKYTYDHKYFSDNFEITAVSKCKFNCTIKYFISNHDVFLNLYKSYIFSNTNNKSIDLGCDFFKCHIY